ncbi:MAG: heparan-alpha-glucosaminide N-acetyltransferase domain-containing protein [Planctomycetota bacterium]
MTATNGRIPGLDLARAAAIFGMIVVNFELAMHASGRGPAWLSALTGALQGRAAGLFVVLAGIGASLGARRALSSGDPVARRAARRQLVRRGLALFALGVAFMSVWDADILHFYGVYFLVGAALLFAPAGALIAAIGLSSATAVMHLANGGWAARWDFTTLTYRGLWTPGGFLRNLVLDGWHPVLPWVALYLFGMLLGRSRLADRVWRRRAGLVALFVWSSVEVCARMVAPDGIETIGPRALAATTCFPPTPAYLIAASAAALTLIALSCEVAERAHGPTLRALEATGRLSLTLYLGHVLVGLGALESLGRLEDRSLHFAVAASVTFFAASVAFAAVWTRRFQSGPLEALLRRL